MSIFSLLPDILPMILPSAVARGLTPLENAGDCDLGGFGDWADAERIVLNLHRAHADLTGTDMDLAAALSPARFR